MFECIELLVKKIDKLEDSIHNLNRENNYVNETAKTLYKVKNGLERIHERKKCKHKDFDKVVEIGETEYCISCGKIKSRCEEKL